MNSIFKFIKEQWIHRRLVIGLSLYSLKSQYANHYLGLFWNILQPAMQVLLYYVVFGLGLRGERGDIGDIPFIVHLITGLFPWMFISGAINSTSNAIQSQLSLVTKMKFPSSTLISMSLVNGLINLCITTSIVVVISLINGFSSPLHYLGFFYFIIASVLFTSSIGLIMSTIVILVRDMKNILQNIVRMFFFVTPIFWSLEGANALMHTISSFNPVAYLVMNYRTALVLQEAPLYGGLSDHIYFWSITALLFYIGVNVHYRFRDKLVDYL